MSTYTDLHNRIKENLTILRKPGSKDDGMSPQKVILINPENQFYGTFNGVINTTGGTLSGLDLVGGTITGATIKEAQFLNGDTPIPIGELANSVSDHEQRISDLETSASNISAAHDSLSTELSTAIDNLSTSINTKIDEAVSEIQSTAGAAAKNIETLSNDLGDLSGKVEDLSVKMLNGVVYRGQLVLRQDKYDLPRSLFTADPSCCLLEGTQLKLLNGWMFRVKLDRSNVEGDYVEVCDPNTETTRFIGEGDYLIIKNHDSSIYEVIPSDEMRMDDFDIINAQDEDDTKISIFKTISAFLNDKIETLSSDLSGDVDALSAALSGEIDALSNSLSDLISSLSGNLCAEIERDRETIKTVSAETLELANNYTAQQITELSGTTSSLVKTTSADTLAQAKTYTEDYTNGRIEELSSTTDIRLSSLSNLLSSYSNQLCSDLSTQVNTEYVHKVGDTIAKLSVEGPLSVVGKTILEDEVEINAGDHSVFKVLESGISAKTVGMVTISTNEKIDIETKAPINATGSRFVGSFTNGVQITTTGGLDDFSVNGKTIQNTLVDLSSELTAWSTARTSELSGEIDKKRNDVSAALCVEIGKLSVSLSNDIDKLSTALSGDIDKLSTSLSTNVDNLSAALCSEIGKLSTSLSNDIDKLSTALSNDIDVLSSSLSGTVDQISAKLQKYSEQLCGEISTQINSEYVHRSGDKIDWIKTPDLSAKSIKVDDSFKAGALSVDSTTNINLKTSESIILHSSGISSNVGLDKVIFDGTSLKTTFDTLDTKKLDVSTASVLSNKICADVIGSGYLKDISVGLEYSSSAKEIRLSAGTTVYSIDAKDFVKDGMLQTVHFLPVGHDGNDTPEIQLIWNGDAGGTEMYIPVSALVDVYTASEDGITLTDNKFSLKYGDIKEKTGLNALSDDLYGVPGDPGTIGRLTDLQNQICAISVDEFGVMAFTGHLVPVVGSSKYHDLSGFLKSCGGFDDSKYPDHVKNGAAFNIFFRDFATTNSKAIEIDVGAGKTLSVGVGDVLIVHDHSNSRYIHLSDLTYAEDEHGNTYLLKAGVSRYEFTALSTSFSGEIGSLSTALSNDIRALSSDLSGEIESLSTSLSTNISSLTSNLSTALSALDRDPLSGLTDTSNISTVISAIVELRDMMKTLRESLFI